MSRQSVDSRPVDTRRPLRLGALALSALMLVTACATGAPRGTAYRDHPLTPRESPEAWALDSASDDGDQEEAVFVTLPTDFAPVQVSDAELSAALVTLWLDTPLRLAR